MNESGDLSLITQGDMNLLAESDEYLVKYAKYLKYIFYIHTSKVWDTSRHLEEYRPRVSGAQ